MEQIRKRLLDDASLLSGSSSTELDVTAGATIAYSSEEPAHPVDNMFDGRNGPGGTYWESARENVTETLVITFDRPQNISRLVFEAEERHFERTQEVRLEVSCDGGTSFRALLVQEFVFSPRGATFQREDVRRDVKGVSHMRLIIVPNKSGLGRAKLTSLRLFT
jgi:F5/8 type C domain-containing protein